MSMQRHLRLFECCMIKNDNLTTYVILGGGLVKDKTGKWRTTHFEEGDNFGAIGDYLRVEAAAVLFKKDPTSLFLILGGKAQNRHLPDAVAVAEINRQELVAKGVPEINIQVEIKSNNTWQQLQEFKAFFREGVMYRFITNSWHINRVKAMMEIDEWYSCLLGHKVIQFEAAEDILASHDPQKWKELIQKAYQSDSLRKRIEKEADGVRQIKEGSYAF
jgi:hypothetical protein